MRAAVPTHRQAPQPAGGEVCGVPLPLLQGRRRDEQRIAVLGHRPEQQPVGQPQQRRMHISQPHLPGRQPLPQVAVRRVLQEPGAKGLQRLLNPLTQQCQRPHPLAHRGGAPALQPAVRRPTPVGHLHPRLVTQQEQRDEVGEHLAVEHRLKVELDVRLSGQRCRVPQQPQHPAVAQHRPQVGVGAVQQLLHHRVRRPLRRPRHSRRPAVQLHPPAQQVDRRRAPQMAHRIRLVPHRQPARGRERHPAVAQLGQQHRQPALTGQPHRRITVRQPA